MTTFGYHLYDFSKRLGESKRERWGGSDNKDLEEVITKCKRFVALGEVPEGIDK